MTYELLLLPRAERDIDGIIRYLSQRSPQGAIAWCDRWEQALDELRSRPLECGLAPESSHYGTSVRQLLCKTRRGRMYRALFTVVGRGVYILHVRAPGRDLLPRDQLRRGR